MATVIYKPEDKRSELVGKGLGDLIGAFGAAYGQREAEKRKSQQEKEMLLEQARIQKERDLLGEDIQKRLMEEGYKIDTKKMKEEYSYKVKEIMLRDKVDLKTAKDLAQWQWEFIDRPKLWEDVKAKKDLKQYDFVVQSTLQEQAHGERLGEIGADIADKQIRHARQMAHEKELKRMEISADKEIADIKSKTGSPDAKQKAMETIRKLYGMIMEYKDPTSAEVRSLAAIGNRTLQAAGITDLTFEAILEKGLLWGKNQVLGEPGTGAVPELPKVGGNVPPNIKTSPLNIEEDTDWD